MPFRFEETLNALNISVTIHSKVNMDKVINAKAVIALPIDKLTGLPICSPFHNKYFENRVKEFEKPIHETIMYGARASACVPMISIKRTADAEKMTDPKYRIKEKTSQFARLWIIKYQRGKSGQIFTEIKSGKLVWLK
jgi:hypothetical protein